MSDENPPMTDPQARWDHLSSTNVARITTLGEKGIGINLVPRRVSFLLEHLLRLHVGRLAAEGADVSDPRRLEIEVEWEQGVANLLDQIEADARRQLLMPSPPGVPFR